MSRVMVHSTKTHGDRAEQLALDYLQARGLRLLARNYKTAGRGGGEVDLIMVDGRRSSPLPLEETLVFVEVRQRRTSQHGGAAASITATKRRRIVFAAQSYLKRYCTPPPCRFDVVAIDGDLATLEWMEGAFEAAV